MSAELEDSGHDEHAEGVAMIPAAGISDEEQHVARKVRDPAPHGDDELFMPDAHYEADITYLSYQPARRVYTFRSTVKRAYVEAINLELEREHRRPLFAKWTDSAQGLAIPRRKRRLRELSTGMLRTLGLL